MHLTSGVPAAFALLSFCDHFNYLNVAYGRWDEVRLDKGEKLCGWTMNGTVVRVPSCELKYGKLNCKFREEPNG